MLGLNFYGVTLTAIPQKNQWLLNLRGKQIAGSIVWPIDYPHRQVSFNLSHLMLNVLTDMTDINIKPSDGPPIDGDCHDVWINGREIWDVKLNVLPERNALLIRQLTIQTGDYQLQSSGEWNRTRSINQTDMHGIFVTQHLGRNLSVWHLTNVLEGGHGQIQYNVHWVGYPWAPYVPTLAGHITVIFNNGLITHLSKSTSAEMGLGRVLNMLSIGTLARTLSLKATHLHGRGFAFNQMGGDITISNGVALTNNSYISGPLAQIKVKGAIGFARENYNLNVEIIPYVTGSLPVIATLVGGPITGLATWFATKLLHPVVGAIAARHYQVTGTWEHPIIQKVGHVSRHFIEHHHHHHHRRR